MKNAFFGKSSLLLPKCFMCWVVFRNSAKFIQSKKRVQVYLIDGLKMFSCVYLDAATTSCSYPF